MIGPSWLADVLAAVVLSVALFSAGRLIASRGRRRQGEVDADGVHAVMGVAMAGMFVPSLATLPNPVWEVIFASGAAWFAWRSVKLRRVSLAGLSGGSASSDVPALSGAAGPGAAGPSAAGLSDSGPSAAGPSAAGPSAAGRAPFPGFSGQCCEYPVPHLIDCVAMLYVLWAVRVIGSGSALGSGGTSGMAGGAGAVRLPALGLVLALCICGYVVWLGDRIQLLTPAAVAAAHDRDRSAAFSGGQSVTIMDSAGRAEGESGSGTFAVRLAGRAQLAPRAATCCKIAMGVAMGVMLIDIL